MNNDLISRQAAIEAMRKAKDKSELHRMLVQLPSAQHVAKDINVPVKDCISREAALTALERDEEYDKDIPNRADGVRDAIITISALPSAQPGWIPTSERLPDNDRAVLVTLKWAEDDYEVAVGEYWHNSTASHGWGSFEGHVIAWHELPTPYREGGQS